MEPFCSKGIRVRDVVGTNSTLTPSFFANASARSGPNPTGLPPVSIEPMGGKSLRTPASSVPAALTLASVSAQAWAALWACAGAALIPVADTTTPAAPRARRRLICFSIVVSPFERPLAVHASMMQDVVEKAPRARGLGVGEEIAARRLFHDHPVVHENDPIGDLARKAHLVRHDQHGHAAVGKIAHDVEHLTDHLGVELRSRLVEQHDFWLHHQRPRNRNPLLLTTGELIWIGADLVGKPYPAQHLLGALASIRH